MLTYSSHAHAISENHSLDLDHVTRNSEKRFAKILIMSHAYACSHIGSYWFNTTELHATKS